MSSFPSPSQSNRPPVWFLLLLGLGGPIAAALTLAQTVAQHPWLAVVIALTYIALILVSSIVAGIWQELRSQWVKKVVDWINGPHDYQKRYCQWLIIQHNQFDVGGLSTYGTPLPTLEQIFVELNLVERPPYQISSAMFKAPEASSASQHPIFYYIGQEKQLVLLGLPGSGKTTLLKNLGLTLVNRKKQRRAPKIQYKLPFFLSLRDYGNTIKDQGQFSLVDAIQSPLRKWDRSAPPGWVESRLNKGGCLILLDGLDEVPDTETRFAMAQWVQQQMITYGHNNRFILTSRPHGYKENALSGVMVLEVQGFTYKQIEEFVHNWYHAEEANRSKHALGSSENAKHGVEDFLRRLHGTPTLSDLARNPLLLTMSIMVHRYRGALPGSRGELYKEICDVSLGGRQRAKGLRLELSPEQNQLVLQPLAFYMMEQEKTEITPAEAQSIIDEPLKSVSTLMKPQEFLKIIEDSNIWVKQGLDVYGFAHLSFQEYLAAMHIKEKDLKQILVKQVGSGWWRETIVLYCNRADASPILKVCLTGKPLTVAALQLALECEEAASRSSSIGDPSVRALFDRVIIQGAGDANPEIRQIVAEARLAQRIKNMLPLDDEVYATTSLISCTEYQLFLDEQRQQGKYYQPDHWTNEHFTPGQGGTPVLGIRPSDALAFCAWLTKRDQGNWRYRLPYTSELQRLEEIATGTMGVAAGMGYWIDEGKGFYWAKSGPLLSSRETHVQLDRSSSHDTDRALNYPLNPADPRHSYLTDHINYARNLAYARTLNENLVRILTSTRNSIHNHELALQAELERAHGRKTGLQGQLAYIQEQESNLQSQVAYTQEQESNLQSQVAYAQEQESNLQSQVAYTQEQESNLQSQLAYAQEQESNLQDQLAYVLGEVSNLQAQLVYNQEEESDLQGQLVYVQEQESDLQGQLTYVQEQESDLQGQLTYVQEQESDLQGQLTYVQEQESSLQAQLIYTQEQESNLQSQLASIHEDGQESSLQAQLVYAQEQESNLQVQYGHFSTKAHAFYNICSRFLFFTPTYNNSDTYSGALTRNHVLNLDRVLVNIDNNASEKALVQVSSLVSNFTRELALSLVSYQSNSDSSIDDHDTTRSIDRALALAQQLDQTSFVENVQNLIHILNYYLSNLTGRRPFGRGRSLMRLFIRYFARELALHSSYWSNKKFISNFEQASHLTESIVGLTIDTYLDVYVAFGILEERIEGRLSACEGILIVRERLVENQE